MVEEQVVEEQVVEEQVVEEQVVEEQVVEEPVVEEQVVEEQVVEEPVVEESVVEEPVVVEEPSVEEQAVEKSSVEEQVVEEQVVEEPSVEEPSVEEQVVEEQVVEEPSVEEPSVEEPSVEEQVVEEQVVEEQVVEEPSVEEPVIEEPVIEEPINIIPKLIFIVPYRDRVEQQRFFSFQMERVLEDYKKSDYKIIYAHQADTREFNRGAMKNLGFLYGKSLYPNHYKNITFVFNDVDTMPYNKNFLNYETVQGNIKHFYGYKFTLGGIVSITGADFEKINGFPNYWAWGYEDNTLSNRVNNAGLTVDRSQFYPILDKNILQLKDGITRIVNRGEFDRYVDESKYNTVLDGVNTISNIVYTFDENTSFLNVTSFQTPVPEKPELNKVYDIRNGNVPFLRNAQQRRRGTMGMMF